MAARLGNLAGCAAPLSGHAVLAYQRFYSSVDAAVSYSGAHRLQFLKRTLFDTVFSFVMNEKRALLRLFQRVAANFNQSFNYPIKRVYIIVPYDQLIGCFNRYINFFFEKGVCMFFCTLHPGTKLKRFW